jgi:hypothetical protein
LRSIITSFVHEHQQQLKTEFEYKRQILILDATDHHLIRAFFTLKPSQRQVGISTLSFLFFIAFNILIDNIDTIINKSDNPMQLIGSYNLSSSNYHHRSPNDR